MFSHESLTGIVLLGHGSSDPGAGAEIRSLVASLAGSRPESRFAHAFLNQDPRLDTAVATLVGEGCARIRVLPLLVFTGRHMAEDVPAAVERLRIAYPSVTFTLEPHLFRLPGFTDLLDTVLKEPA